MLDEHGFAALPAANGHDAEKRSTGNGMKPTFAPAQPGCWSVAPLVAAAVHRSHRRSLSLDARAPSDDRHGTRDRRGVRALLTIKPEPRGGGGAVQVAERGVGVCESRPPNEDPTVTTRWVVSSWRRGSEYTCIKHTLHECLLDLPWDALKRESNGEPAPSQTSQRGRPRLRDQSRQLGEVRRNQLRCPLNAKTLSPRR